MFLQINSHTYHIRITIFFAGKRLELGPHTTTEEVRLSEVDEAGENLALSSGRPLFPLPRGRISLHFCSFSLLSVFILALVVTCLLFILF